MNWFWILVGILVLGLMVLVHEWGHFIVAKLLKVRVDVFSIGFGPRLFGLRRGPTDYRLSALPLGGYVRMAGDNPAETRSGAPDEFLSKPRWQRALIVLAGPTTNLLLAVLILAGVFAYRYERPAYLEGPAVVAFVKGDSPAGRAGVQAGDRIVRFAEVRHPTWEDLLIEAAFAGQQPIPVEIERGESRLALTLQPPAHLQEQLWDVGWRPAIRFMVEMVQPDSPAARAGLRPGDVLVALNDEPLHPTSSEDNPLSERLQETAGTPVVLTLERQGRSEQVTVTPAYGDLPQGKRWLLGISIGPEVVRRELTAWQALGKAVDRNLRDTGRMLDFLGRLFTGRASLRGLQGPVGIVRFSGEAGQQGGPLAVINLTVLISLSLGILNLLPIPILDGGHLAVLGVEALRQRDLSLTVKERITQVGFVFLLLVFAVVMYNDIVRIFMN